MLEQVKEILAKYTEAEIMDDSQLEADLGLSSFDMVSIVTVFEDAFWIKISYRDLRNLVSV